MKNSPAILHMFQWGSITGSVLLVLHLAIFYSSADKSGFIGFLPVLTITIGMFVSAIRYRNRFKGGFSQYAPMFGQTFGVGVISSLFYLMFLILLVYRLDLLFIDKYMDTFQETMQTLPNVPDLYGTPEFAALYRKILIPSLFFSDLFSNTLYALIIAWAAVRKPWKNDKHTPSQDLNKYHSSSDEE